MQIQWFMLMKVRQLESNLLGIMQNPFIGRQACELTKLHSSSLKQKFSINWVAMIVGLVCMLIEKGFPCYYAQPKYWEPV